MSQQQQWYMAIGGHQVGPVSQDDVVTNLRNGTIDGNTLVFTSGMSNWTPLKQVPQLASFIDRRRIRRRRGLARTAADRSRPPRTRDRLSHRRQRDAVR
jgi:hypothetical protein